MDRLQQKNYAHQMDENEAEQMHKIKLHLKAKAAGQLSSAQHQTSTMNVGKLDNLTESQTFEPFVSKNDGWRRIMSYYKPWSANIAIGVLSILNTF
jgi:hypothetical protein